MSKRPHQTVELTRVRLLEFLREPEILFWVFIFPIVLAVALGIAFRTQGEKVLKIGVLGSEGAAALHAPLAAAKGLEATVFAGEHEARRALFAGEILLLVEPANPVVYHFDPDRPESRLARLEVDAALQIAAGRTDPRPSLDREVTEHGARYIDFLIPGLLGMNIMGTGIWGIGFALVQTRQRKLLKLLLVTPMRRPLFLLSYINARLIFLVLEVAILLLFASLVFHVPLRGALVSFALLCLVGAMSFAGLGLLLASRAKTAEGVQGLMNLAMMPMWLLSGVFFSYKNFPDAMQPICKALPLTALNDSLRAIMLEGTSILDLGPQLGIMAAWGALCFALALKLFRWH